MYLIYIIYLQFVFYGYCGCDPLDGLAIDDILLLTGEGDDEHII